MLGKAFDFLVSVVMNGIIALFLTLVLYIILAVLFMLAMIPVDIIFGDSAAKTLTALAGNDWTIRILYALVFFSLLADDLGWPNLKTKIKNQFRKKE